MSKLGQELYDACPYCGIHYARRFVCAGCLDEICTACSPGTSGLCESCVNKQKTKEKQ